MSAGGVSIFHTLTEIHRAAGEFAFAKTGVSKLFLKAAINHGDETPVMTLPGFLARDSILKPLRNVLSENNYAVYDWRQGRNMGPVKISLDQVADRIVKISRKHDGRPVHLIGQSLGGAYALKLAAQLAPENVVERVITLGSPVSEEMLNIDGGGVQGGVRSVFNLLNPPDHKKMIDFMDSMAQLIKEGLPGIRVSAVFSNSDGVIGGGAAQISLEGQQKENIEIFGASHLGMGFNALVHHVILNRLAQPDGEFTPFGPNDYPYFLSMLFPQNDEHKLTLS